MPISIQSSLVSPCNACDFSGAELSSSCRSRIVKYCLHNFELDRSGCIEFLDIIVGGTCDFNFVPKPVQADLTRWVANAFGSV